MLVLTLLGNEDIWVNCVMEIWANGNSMLLFSLTTTNMHQCTIAVLNQPPTLFLFVHAGGCVVYIHSIVCNSGGMHVAGLKQEGGKRCES